MLHLVGIGVENDADFVVDAVFQGQLVEQRGIDLLRDGGLDGVSINSPSTSLLVISRAR